MLEAPLTKICPCGHATLLPQYCPPAYAHANLSSLMAYLKDVPLIAWAGVAHTPLLCIRRVVGVCSHFAEPSTSSKRRMLARGHAIAYDPLAAIIPSFSSSPIYPFTPIRTEPCRLGRRHRAASVRFGRGRLGRWERRRRRRRLVPRLGVAACICEPSNISHNDDDDDDDAVVGLVCSDPPLLHFESMTICISLLKKEGDNGRRRRSSAPWRRQRHLVVVIGR